MSLNCILIKQSDGCRPMKDVVGDVDDIPEGYPALDISLTGISIEMCFCNQDLCNGQYVSHNIHTLVYIIFSHVISYLIITMS